MDKDNFPRYEKIIAAICLVYTLLGVLCLLAYDIGLSVHAIPSQHPAYFYIAIELGVFIAASLALFLAILWYIRHTRFKGFNAFRAEEFSVLFDKAPVGISKLLPDGRYIKVNQQLCDYLGYTEAELMTMTFMDVTHKDSEAESALNRQRMASGETDNYSTEKCYIKKDGSLLWAQIKVTCIKDDTGKTQYFITVVIDISERKKAQLAIVENNRYFQTILENTFDGIALVSAKGEIIYQTPSAEKIIGYTFEERKGKNSLGNIPPEDIPKSIENFKYLIDNPGVQQFVTSRFIHKDGTERILEISAKNMLSDPLINAIVTNFRDITEKQITQDKIYSSIIEGEDRERQRIASELHDSLGQQLTASALNFQAILGAVAQLEQEKQQQFHLGLNFLNKAIEESRNIAHNLMPMSIKDFGLILSMESLVASIRKTSGLDIIFYQNLGKERFSKQVETNLYRITQEALNNVIKHSGAKQVNIQLIRHPNSLVYTFEDDGIGFDTASQEDNISGMGLNNIHNRVKALSGELSIDSKKGEGTNITIELKASFRSMDDHSLQNDNGN